MDNFENVRPKRVGIAVLGTVGKSLAKALDRGIPGVELVAVAARNESAARDWLSGLSSSPKIASFEEIAETCDVVIECAPAQLLPQIAEPALRAGRQVVVLSCGALLDNDHLTGLAAQHGGQIMVPSGALLGLDAVTAAAEGEISSVQMITRKPVSGLLGAPYLLDRGISLDGCTERTLVFSGTAREAARGFPANLNVAVALALAGIGPDRTQLEIWADPDLKRNTHTITVESDAARLSMTIENIPTENPKTGRITAQSILALLRKMSTPLRVGS
ncbi:aspartate dehydrogenase [Paraburkholderia ginsengiterrae]|uniref:L-aspartate dehydrogenase n=1 Tax=Paraburkholderia ginsengiterrae TaxID=1462993 RepID=A0A1A9MW28_9BURK|nr:aspartate dehydrogenase [Paraburkholderia ginsengiterrae]OAJ52046.1 aspartate dehydrogenase [Paraburkholderia ginsengiterrae]OAJ63408.1 aspartate dehydrogenase [Paraburkholderia ginsengiterrae]